MFKASEKIRTETAFLFANGIQIAALEQQSKKTLREIFRVFGSDPPVALQSHRLVASTCGKVFPARPLLPVTVLAPRALYSNELL
jgi:hypothetical protein